MINAEELIKYFSELEEERLYARGVGQAFQGFQKVAQKKQQLSPSEANNLNYQRQINHLNNMTDTYGGKSAWNNTRTVGTSFGDNVMAAAPNNINQQLNRKFAYMQSSPNAGVKDMMVASRMGERAYNGYVQGQGNWQGDVMANYRQRMQPGM